MKPSARRQHRPRRLLVRIALALLMTTLISNQRVRTAGAVIHVTTTNQGVANDGLCSLQEAIYAANLDSGVAPGTFFPTIFFSTSCEAGNGDDVIQLQAGATYSMSSILNDPYNALGPTATPIILSNVTIEANGARLVRPNPGRDFTGLPNFRAFAVANADFVDPDHDLGIAGSRGSLTLRNAHVKGFTAHGGNGADGGGGGMGAGGAIYVAGGTLTIESSTFQDNGAHGGNGSHNFPGWAGGGGGGFSGNGGEAIDGGGGGGGGARGDGGDGAGGCGTPCLGLGVSGGGGGGTLHGGANGANFGPINGGTRCGGDGGYITLNPLDSPRDGRSGRCPGGGGGGGRDSFFLFAEVSGGNGGTGDYGGGGGGGAFRMTHGDGGRGGFGGGGGAGDQFDSNFPSGLGPDGGDGGFGGGGGAAHGGFIAGAPGDGGSFAGHAIADEGGGGAGLGGAIFSHRGTVVIRNSTFYGNFAIPGSPRGAARGAAVFAVDSSVTVLNATLAHNEVLGRGAGIVIYRSTESGTSASLTLRNTIISNSFPADRECFYLGGTVTVAGSGNLITHNSDAAPAPGANPAVPEFRCPGNIVDAPGDPLLGPLTLNAPGLTPTAAINSLPALDAGDLTTCEAFDQRGVSRPQQASCDIGAYEARQPDFTVNGIDGFSMELGATATLPFTVSSIDGFNAAVALAVDAGTTGLDASVSPNSVTPQPNQPASATLTVHAGSNVVAGNHWLTLTATSGTTKKQISFRVAVGVTFGGMAITIDEFLQRGEIANVGVATALNQKLKAAQKLADSGDLQAAVNVLAAFEWQVRALSGKLIASAAADRLLANLDALAANVAPQLVPNPVIGTVVSAEGSPVAQTTITIVDAQQSLVADAETDALGFYYFARTSGLAAGASYSVKVTLTKGYKRSTPSTQTFTWQGSPVTLPAFLLSK